MLKMYQTIIWQQMTDRFEIMGFLQLMSQGCTYLYYYYLQNFYPVIHIMSEISDHQWDIIQHKDQAYGVIVMISVMVIEKYWPFIMLKLLEYKCLFDRGSSDTGLEKFSVMILNELAVLDQHQSLVYIIKVDILNLQWTQIHQQLLFSSHYFIFSS